MSWVDPPPAESLLVSPAVQVEVPSGVVTGLTQKAHLRLVNDKRTFKISHLYVQARGRSRTAGCPAKLFGLRFPGWGVGLSACHLPHSVNTRRMR